jgi:hypothetical protein
VLETSTTSTLALAVTLRDLGTYIALVAAVAALIGAVARLLETYLNFKSRRKK